MDSNICLHEIDWFCSLHSSVVGSSGRYHFSVFGFWDFRGFLFSDFFTVLAVDSSIEQIFPGLFRAITVVLSGCVLAATGTF